MVYIFLRWQEIFILILLRIYWQVQQEGVLVVARGWIPSILRSNSVEINIHTYIHFLARRWIVRLFGCANASSAILKQKKKIFAEFDVNVLSGMDFIIWGWVEEVVEGVVERCRPPRWPFPSIVEYSCQIWRGYLERYRPFTKQTYIRTSMHLCICK